MPGCRARVEHLVRLDLDGQVAASKRTRRCRRAGSVVEDEEVGLADTVGLVVDREPAPADDRCSGRDGLHGVPFPGVGVLDLDHPCALDVGEQRGERLVLVVLTGMEQLLEEGGGGRGSHGRSTSSWTRWGQALAK